MNWCAKGTGSGNAMRQTIATGFLYFGGANAFLSRYAGTCTQDVADQLVGLWVVLLAYGAALALLWRGPPGRIGLVLLLPVGAVMLWHGAEGLRFAWGVFMQGASACSLLVDPPYGHDGREAQFALLWLLCGIVLPAMLLWRVAGKRAAGT
jgi:hypothetical protein